MAKKKGPPNGRRDDSTTSLEAELMPFRISRLGDVVEPNPKHEVLQHDRRRFNPTKTVSPPGNRNAARIVSTVKQGKRFVDYAIEARTAYKRAHLLVGSPTRYLRRKHGFSTLKERLAFNVPKRLELCIRRAIRKQVIHAKKKAGKVGQKRPNRNFWSAISCSRR